MANNCSYNELMELYKDYCNTIDEIYKLSTCNEEEINKIYNDIKSKLIQTGLLSPDEVLQAVLYASYYNNRYNKSYLSICKKIYDENTEYINIYENVLEKITLRCSLMDVYEENTIYRAIMYDDLISLIKFTELEGFDKDQKLKSRLFEPEPVSLLELCCYYGAVNCFKLLRTKFNLKITEECLDFSFLSGKPDIISECLKKRMPDAISMKHAIISRNLDFICFLNNEYNIEISYEFCSQFHNLQAFFIYLDQTKDINKCFVCSPCFGIPSLCEYFLSHGADINANAFGFKTILHMSTICCKTKVVEALLTHGVEIDAKDCYQKTAVFYAIEREYNDIAELLITHGADVNLFDIDNYAALHIAASKQNKSIVELLISHGALINAQDESGFTPLHHATICFRIEIAEFLILNGADVNIKDKHGSTPLIYASNNSINVIAELLISHGADVNTTDQYGRTPLHYSSIYHNDYLKELLLHMEQILI
ncbi:ankyrin repeat protein, putative [Trichomonas vaginalis G3]|uniref:Ankyrin repeat protein, putative n=1 Tax=Trichomonas vaginalis (strain ATCC PRA-98 / G3) TaxID=412133 RepID=A2D9T5_TRIV3|nr:protein kinase protein [Trichomonas vaginalis G3]EAY22941.1 ankyrin repeat protein, putative [Trichomonas vaginalis G3]KAI5527307.1 protein kinase protein [Trichomonas vaginalis G3]|eukprot:XP_001583927.1 ankyrin repeat protein [Trichomonas vaginalis G3]